MSSSTMTEWSESLIVSDRASFTTCSCQGTLAVSINYADMALPIRVDFHHRTGCADHLRQWRSDEPTPLPVLMQRVIPPTTAAEIKAQWVALVDRGECDARCLFADAATDRSCDCPCEGVYHGAARWTE